MSTRAPAAVHTAEMPQPPLPGVWRAGLSRGQVELKAFFRERQAVVFILAMPAVMLVLSAWIGAGLVLCLTTFRWQNRQDR